METLPMSLSAQEGACADLEDLRVHHPVEVQNLLKRFVDGNVLLTLHAPGGTSYTTTLWAADPARGTLAFAGGNDARVQQLCEADEVVAVGYLDSIKVQFDVPHITLVRSRTGSALSAPYPSELLRFQRRSSFRVRPVGNTAQAKLKHPMLVDTHVQFRVIDVSLSGVALFQPDNVPGMPAGVTLNDVQLDLDSDTRLVVRLRVHHVTVMNPEARGARLGCEMIGLSGEATRALQRFVDSTQKRSRMLGL